MGQRISARDLELGEEKVVRVNRTSAVVKGGRRFSFAAVVIIGDRRGVVGYGQGKAREVPTSIEKAVRDARKNLVRYPLRGDTIPHTVWGRFRASRVLLRPAAPGTGIKAGATVRAVVEELGVRNILTKIYGSRNPVNIVKATLNGLDQLLSKKEVFELRGLPVHADREGPKLEPVGLDDNDRRRGKKDTRGGGKPRGGKDGGRGGSRGKGGNKPNTEAAPAEAKAEKPAEAPKPEAPKTETDDKGGAKE
ncbi:MAG: 30S ribosomal protein S5 [Planctomycetes bacterium]|nr:30S ribosomal protein S5 [Planctomycetota bacterium]MCA8945255.1 30S ribosomal protein S5 [Planctomycetota bacterium]